jgi:hypothetical protein
MHKHLLVALALVAAVGVAPAAALTTYDDFPKASRGFVDAEASLTWSFTPKQDVTLTAVRVCAQAASSKSRFDYYFSYAMAITAPGDSTPRQWSAKPRWGETSLASREARGGGGVAMAKLKAGLTYTVKLTNNEAVRIVACGSTYLVQLEYSDGGATNETPSGSDTTGSSANNTLIIIGVISSLVFCAACVGVIACIVWTSRRSRRAALQQRGQLLQAGHAAGTLQQPMVANDQGMPGMPTCGVYQQPGMQPGQQQQPYQAYQAGMAQPMQPPSVFNAQPRQHQPRENGGCVVS